MLKVLELFAGIGACSSALERLGIEHEIVDAVEIDKYAIKSFNQIHGTNFDTQDICTWDKDLDCDLIMHGSPCQDFSIAGLQAGGDIGSGTRSSLMYETVRIVGKLRPKYVIWENVKNVLSQKHKHNFDNYLNAMASLGYKNFYEVLNAKDYGIPQNRERVFTISIRNDIKKEYTFPPKKELYLRLKDVLEDEVDERYYLSDIIIKGFTKHNENHEEKGTGFIWKPKEENDIASCLRANAALCPTDNTVVVNRLGGIFDKDGKTKQAGGIFDKDGLAPTLTDMQGGYRQPLVKDPKMINNCRIRKLTPRECWRLMGFTDEEFDKASQGISNTQLYKMAGNSIVVNVLVEIFKNLFEVGDV